MHHRPLKTVLNIFKCQVFAALFALLIVAAFRHPGLLAFFLGEIVMLAGNAFLAWRVYQQNKKIIPASLLLNFVGGEAGKYGLLVILTFLIAKYLPVNWLFYILGIAVPQLLGVILYLLARSNHLFKSFFT